MALNWSDIGGMAIAGGTVSTALLFAVNSLIDSKINKLNGTYVRSRECGILTKEKLDRLDKIEEKLDGLKAYTHELKRETSQYLKDIPEMMTELIRQFDKIQSRLNELFTDK